MFYIDIFWGYLRDRAYFKALHDWIANGGVAAALDYFLKVDISEFNPRIIPAGADSASKVKIDQKMRSASNNIKFIAHLLSTQEFRYKKGDRDSKNYNDNVDENEEAAGLRVHNTSGTCYIQWQLNGVAASIVLPKDTLYELYTEFCKTQKGGNTDTKEVLGRFLKGGIAGSKNTRFANETQEHGKVLGKGRKWKLEFNELRSALSIEMESDEIECSFELDDVVDTGS